MGFSKYPFKAVSQRAPRAPSTTLWSALRVTFMDCTTLNPRVVSSGEASGPIGTSLGTVELTARMHACGGLIMAVKCSTPYIPMLEMVNVPPWYSSPLSFPSRAFLASTLVSAEMAARPLFVASRTMGVIRPVGVDTAKDISAREYLQNNEPVRKEQEKVYILPDCFAKPSDIGLGDITKS